MINEPFFVLQVLQCQFLKMNSLVVPQLGPKQCQQSKAHVWRAESVVSRHFYRNAARVSCHPPKAAAQGLLTQIYRSLIWPYKLLVQRVEVEGRVNV